MMKHIFRPLLITLGLGLTLSACKSLDSELPNPNVPGETQVVPPSLLLPRVEFDTYEIGTGSGPFSQAQRWNQFSVSNNLYYGGQNQYSWTTNGSMYGVLTNTIQMETQAARSLGSRNSAYAALAKFFRAYAFVWEATRVGDTPATQAGQGLTNLTPVYDIQKAVFARSLTLLDSASTILAGLSNSAATLSAGQTSISGDIYYNNNLSQWRKAINSFRLRVLISLSKRAGDNADLQIPQQFAAIVNNPTTYPLLSGNADNLSFVFNSAYNTYPHTPNDGNNQYQNVGATFLGMTTATQDPRTFIAATPAPAQLMAGKKVSDFTAYVGADISQSIDNLRLASNSGAYSFTNNQRYYGSVVGPEPFIILGYAEQNFNIAEAINRGWVPGASASSYYLKGINASLSFYGLTEGQAYPIGDLSGKALGTATVSISTFLGNADVVYKGDNTAGLEQIINQKYVAFHQNSGYEAFYNWRRTGFPRTFASTGGGINASSKIPRRWQYPVDEQTYNPDNYKGAIQSQFGGTDDLNQDTWLTK